MIKDIAIVIVCYKRLEGVKRLIKSLEIANYQGCEDVTLIFSIDNSGFSDIEDYANAYNWNHGPKRIIIHEKRQGLKAHILKCGDLTNDYDAVCILEDDLIVSDSYFSYILSATEFYENDDYVAGISLYSFQKNWLNWFYRFEAQKNGFDAYFMKVAQSWGQVWTKKQWASFKEWYLKKDGFKSDFLIPDYLTTWPETSWLKYYDLYLIETNKFFVYPYYSLSSNFSDAGEHSKRKNTDHQVELIVGKTKWSYDKFSTENSIIYDEYMDRMQLGKYLDIDDALLTNDINGTKRPEQYTKYVLTLKKLDYKVVSTFEICLRPIELSIIYKMQGDGIFLYDTSEVHKNTKKRNKLNEYVYYTRSSHFLISLKYSIVGCFLNLIRKLRNIFKR